MKCRSGPISAFSSFNYELLLGGGKRRLVLFVLVLVLGILASAVPSGASTVGCAGASGGPFDFTSLTAALNAPGALMNNTITLSGICTESAVIFGAQNLNIIGTPGAALMDPGGSAIGAVLEIDNSQGMNVRTLRIQLSARTAATGIPGVAVNSSTVHLFQCQIEGAAGSDGIDISGPNADVRIHGGIIENNNDGQGNGEGVFVQGPGAILFLLSDEAGNCPLIQGSGDSGIWATATGAHVAIPPIRGCATIQNNFTGIQLNLGATVGIGVSQNTPVRFSY